jgi:hypothetical protein
MLRQDIHYRRRPSLYLDADNDQSAAEGLIPCETSDDDAWSLAALVFCNALDLGYFIASTLNPWERTLATKTLELLKGLLLQQ